MGFSDVFLLLLIFFLTALTKKSHPHEANLHSHCNQIKIAAFVQSYGVYICSITEIYIDFFPFFDFLLFLIERQKAFIC